MDGGVKALIETLSDPAIEAVKFGEFTLKSGDISPIYIDLRTIITYPLLLKQVAEQMWRKFESFKDQFASICGVPYAALPIASCISVNHDRPMLILRKEEKQHGTKKRIEGRLTPGESCLIIEDVVTTGSSILETAKVLREHGLVVRFAAVILDREQGAKELLNANGIQMISIFTLTDLLKELASSGKLDTDIRIKIDNYMTEHRSKMHKTNGIALDKASAGDGPMSFEERLSLVQHRRTRQLFEIMLAKKSNLCVAADLCDTASILKLAEVIGPEICALKLHADIIKDFTHNFTMALKNLASRYNFIIIEDRKFADVGNIAALQSDGFFNFSSWVDAFTVHAISGPGILDGMAKVCTENNIALFLIAQMSSKGSLFTPAYVEEVTRMANNYPHLVAGFICQTRVSNDPKFVYLSPGVHMEKSSDNVGQQWRTPEDAVRRDGVDVIIVGRGVVEDPNPAAAAKRYREISWQAIQHR